MSWLSIIASVITSVSLTIISLLCIYLYGLRKMNRAKKPTHAEQTIIVPEKAWVSLRLEIPTLITRGSSLYITLKDKEAWFWYPTAEHAAHYAFEPGKVLVGGEYRVLEYSAEHNAFLIDTYDHARLSSRK